jgi:hypothetical protein
MSLIRYSLLALTAASLLAGLAAPRARAESTPVDRRLSYQGQIRGVSGPTALRFELFDAAGDPVWGPEEHVVSPDAEGRFFVKVGSSRLDADADGIPDLDALDPRNLELQLSVVDAAGQALALGERQRLAPAFHAATADRVLGGVPREALASGAVTTAKLSDASVSGAKLMSGSLGGGQVAGSGLTGAEIQDGSVTAAHLKAGALAFQDIAFETLTSSDIAAGAVGGFELRDGTLTHGEISSTAFFRARSCQWSGHLNEAYQAIDATCASGQLMQGLYSTPVTNDRRFQILCCNVGP